MNSKLSSSKTNHFTSADVTMFDVRGHINPKRENKHSSAASLSIRDVNSNGSSSEKNLTTSAEVTMYNARGAVEEEVTVGDAHSAQIYTPDTVPEAQGKSSKSVMDRVKMFDLNRSNLDVEAKGMNFIRVHICEVLGVRPLPVSAPNRTSRRVGAAKRRLEQS